LAINWANEDPGRGRTTYCDRDDVYLLMHGVMPDVEGDPLEAFANSNTLNRILSSVLEPTKQDLDADCGRDFDYHADVEIAVNGGGTDEIDLSYWGFVPLLDVTSVQINDGSERLSEYTWDQMGVVSPTSFWGGMPLFYRGYRNVAMTITWGFEEPPADVRLAHAKRVGIEILNRITAANAAEPGMIGGAQRVQFGDLVVNNYSRGRYSPTIDQWEKDIKRAIDRYRILRVGQNSPKVYDGQAATRMKQFRTDR